MSEIKENLKEIAKILNCDEKKLIDEIKKMIEYSNEKMLLNFIQDEVIDNSLKAKKLDFLEEVGEPSFYYDDVKESILDFNMFIKTLKNENSINGLTDKDREIICLIMDKYNIKPVERGLNTYEHILYIHKKIFGEFKDD